jgi:hypothetical protein
MVLGLIGAAGHAQPFDAWAIYGGGHSEIPDAAALDPTEEITLEAWVNADADSTGGCATIVGKGYTVNYWLGLCSDTIRSYVGGVSRTSAQPILDTGIVHVAMTSDGTTRRHYVNGCLTDEFPETGTLTPNDAPVRLARDVSWPVVFHGIIDEVRLWNVARTERELDRYKDLAIDVPFEGLVAVWSFGPNDVFGVHDGTNVGAVAGLTVPAGACWKSTSQLCLNGRFRVTVDWESPTDSGSGVAVPEGSPDSGMFWFFQENNWEFLVKVLNACSLNNRVWVFAAATTDVGYTLTVHDEFTGEEAVYVNPVGVASPAITDSGALDVCSFP